MDERLILLLTVMQTLIFRGPIAGTQPSLHPVELLMLVPTLFLTNLLGFSPRNRVSFF